MNKKLYNYLVAAICFIIAGYIASLMSTEKLWSNLPLFLFLSIWIGFVLLVDLKLSSTRNTNNSLILSALSGLLLSLAFPPFGFTPLIFFALIPLFYLEDKKEIDKPHTSFYIYNALVLWNILDTYWVANAALIPGIVAIWLNSFFMLVPWLVAQKIGRIMPKLKWWSFISFWICFELLHLNWEISWPWLTLGNAWSAHTSWIQWYEYTGVFGGTLWILLVNVLFYQWFIKTNSFRNFQIKQFLILRKKQILVLLTIIVLPILISLYRYSTYLPEGKYGEVCLVQPNYEPHYEKFVVPEMDQITRLGRLAELVINKETKFIVFPETSFGDTGDGPLNKDRIGEDNRIILFYDFIETHMNIPIVMGVTTVHILKDSSKHTPFTRINPRTNSAYEIANSAIILKNRTERIPVYNKSRLVPGAEIFPYRKILPFLKPLVDMLGGSIQGLATQEERSVFESKGYIIAPVICYESIYGNYLRGYIKNGAQAIFVMTNDGWWDDTPGYKQHMAYSKLSAVEFRRPVLRSANTGITCFINSKGDVGKSINYGVHSAINQGITFSTEMTFYSLFGDLIGYAALITSFILLILFFLVKQKKQN